MRSDLGENNLNFKGPNLGMGIYSNNAAIERLKQSFLSLFLIEERPRTTRNDTANLVQSPVAMPFIFWNVIFLFVCPDEERKRFYLFVNRSSIIASFFLFECNRHWRTISPFISYSPRRSEANSLTPSHPFIPRAHLLLRRYNYPV